MSGYATLVMLLCFLVELLLLLGTDRLCGNRSEWWRAALGAGLSGVYAGVCLLQGFSVLGNAWCRLISLFITAVIAYGVSFASVRATLLFVLLNLAIEGVSNGFSSQHIWVLIGILMILLLRRGGPFCESAGRCLPIEICYRGRTAQLTALVDTGNTLRDPLTGEPVLILDADAACLLTGLSRQQLRMPLETMANAHLPGIRLIPYHTVGQSTGFLLGVRMHNVKIQGKRRSAMVAFAPEGFGEKKKYQALTGGVCNGKDVAFFSKDRVDPLWRCLLHWGK